MKTRLYLPLFLPLLFFFANAGFVCPVFAGSSGGYVLGKEKGFADGVSGLSRTPTRHEAIYSEADRADFFRGYEAGYSAGIKPGAKPPENLSHGQPLTVKKGRGTVTVTEGKTVRSVCKTALPNVEEIKFIEEQMKLVVKSRGNHGPAIVQLFKSYTGEQIGQVKAYEIKPGKPAWAAGMGE
jgi:hypothetical protein